MLFSESVVGWTSSDSDLVYPRPSDQDELITAGASDSDSGRARHLDAEAFDEWNVYPCIEPQRIAPQLRSYAITFRSDRWLFASVYR